MECKNFSCWRCAVLRVQRCGTPADASTTNGCFSQFGGFAREADTAISRTQVLATSVALARDRLGEKNAGLDARHQMRFVKCMYLRCCVVGNGSDGFYQGWGKDVQHREECRIFGIFPEFVAGGQPPWRLTKTQIKLLDNRVKKIWWTHYSDKLAWGGACFFLKTDRIWKAKHKVHCLLTILTSCLRGSVK